MAGMVRAVAARVPRDPLILRISRRARRLGHAFLHGIVCWSERYYASADELGSTLERLPADKRLEAALRWHANRARPL